MIEAVVFDVGQVLYQWDLRHLFRKLLPDEAQVERFVREVIGPEWHFQTDAGRPVAEMVAERRAEFPRHAALIEAYGTRFNETIPGPVPGSLELVERLHARGVPLFAITNFGHEFWAGFRPTAPVFELFDDIVVSGTEKLAKPDPAIFALAVQRFGYPPGAMLFVDDNAANVASARVCGWHAHHFVDAAGLETELIERGLL
ncbi:MAG TPA: HAD family phosphatase [Novosphingobium sp.]|nr:HAD family phosphatase [Novosphingobium sp.]